MEIITGYILGIIVLVLLLSGCGGLGMDFTDQRTYAITKPPYQIVVSGDLTNADKKAIAELIKQLALTPYQEYKFNEKITISVIGSETQIKNVNIHQPGAVDEN